MTEVQLNFLYIIPSGSLALKPKQVSSQRVKICVSKTRFFSGVVALPIPSSQPSQQYEISSYRDEVYLIFLYTIPSLTLPLKPKQAYLQRITFWDSRPYSLSFQQLVSISSYQLSPQNKISPYRTEVQIHFLYLILSRSLPVNPKKASPRRVKIWGCKTRLFTGAFLLHIFSSQLSPKARFQLIGLRSS